MYNYIKIFTAELEELLAEPDLTETDQNAIIAQKKIEHDDQLDNFNRYIIQELDKKVFIFNSFN